MIPRDRSADLTPDMCEASFYSFHARMENKKRITRELNPFDVDMIKGLGAEAILRMGDRPEYRHRIKDIIKARDELIRGM